MVSGPSTLRHPDDAARGLARQLLSDARFAALGVLNPETGWPFVSRILIGLSPDRLPLSLVSDLALHTRAIRARPEVSLLIGGGGLKGDPLTHPRLTLQARARILSKDKPETDILLDGFLQSHPKSRLYAGFADFNLIAFDVESAFLNGGFGQAFALTRSDL